MSTQPPQPSPEVPPISGQLISASAETASDLLPEQQGAAGDSQPSVAGVRERQAPAQETSPPAPAATSAPGKSPNANPGEAQAAAPVPLADRFPIQVYSDESFIKNWGPIITSLASLVLTFFVWHKGEILNKQQIDLQRQQTELQSQLVQGELTEMRSKFFSDVTSVDDNKRTLAAIGLAGHGSKALHVVHLALGVEQGDIRKGAVNVVYRLFQAAMKPEERAEILKHLLGEFNSPNKLVRMGVVQSLVKIEPLLNPIERQQMTAFLLRNVDPRTICSDLEGRETVQEAAKFFTAKNTESITYLLTIAQFPGCGDGWLQAMNKLNAAAGGIPSAQRAALRTKVEQLEKEVIEGLRGDVSDDDLEGGGFGNFMQKGQDANFENFKQRVQDEFDALSQLLAEQEGMKP